MKYHLRQRFRWVVHWQVAICLFEAADKVAAGKARVSREMLCLSFSWQRVCNDRWAFPKIFTLFCFLVESGKVKRTGGWRCAHKEPAFFFFFVLNSRKRVNHSLSLSCVVGAFLWGRRRRRRRPRFIARWLRASPHFRLAHISTTGKLTRHSLQLHWITVPLHYCSVPFHSILFSVD